MTKEKLSNSYFTKAKALSQNRAFSSEISGVPGAGLEPARF